MTMMLAGAYARRHQVASIAFRAAAGTSVSGASISVTIPLAAHVGDVAFIFLDYNIIGPQVVATGPNLVWTQLGTEQQDAAELGSRVYWRTLGVGDPGTSITITFSPAGGRANMIIGVWSGVNTTAPVAGFAQASETGTSDLHVTPSVVNNTANAWRVDFVQDKTSTGTTIWSVPTLAVKRFNCLVTASGAFTSVVGDSAGPVGANGATQGLQTYDSDVSTAKATMWTLLLAPGGAGAGNPNSGRMIFGMFNSCTTTGSDGYNGGYPGSTSAHYAEINSTYMDNTLIKVRRSFNTGLPANLAASDGANDAANGLVPCISVKSDPAGTAAGTFDATITTLAASMPAGSYLIWHHEPENDMAGTVFTPASVHFYDVAKAANANLLIGPSYMAYQWRSDKPSTASPDDWWPGTAHCDFLAVDTYIFDWQATVSGIGSSTDSGFTRWHSWASTKAKPLIVTELGLQVDSADPNHLNQKLDSDRVTMLGGSIDFLKAAGYAMVLYWNGYHSDAGVHDLEITPTVSKPAGHPSVLAVWNTKVAAYGSTSTDIRDLI